MDLTYNELTTAVSEKLKSLQYSDSTVQKYWREWTKFEKYLNECKIQDFSMDVILKYFLSRYGIDYNASVKEHTRGMRQTMRALRVLADFQQFGIIYRRFPTKNHVWPDSFKQPLDEFMNLIEETLAKGTFRQFRSHIECLISFIEKQGCNSFNEITPKLIIGFHNSRATLSKKSNSYDAYVLRKLFDFLYERGFCMIDYSVFVPNIKSDNKGGIPSFYTANEISLLLSMIDRANPTGKRDYAIMLLAIRYGIRVSDIRNLKLSDFDWKNSEFSFVQSKTGKLQKFVILPEVATSIIDYFQNGRPETESRFVFIRHIAPYCEFGKDNNLYNIISKYMNMAGFTDFHHRKHGLHSLRHSVAGNMLNQGIPLPTISEVLGHSSTETTMIYTKIGLNQLSTCALEVD